MQAKIKRYELMDSTIIKGEYRIHDNATGKAAEFTTRSELLKKIKRKFKASLCSRDMFYFAFITDENAETIRKMLPTNTLR